MQFFSLKYLMIISFDDLMYHMTNSVSTISKEAQYLQHIKA